MAEEPGPPGVSPDAVDGSSSQLGHVTNPVLPGHSQPLEDLLLDRPVQSKVPVVLRRDNVTFLTEEFIIFNSSKIASRSLPRDLKSRDIEWY